MRPLTRVSSLIFATLLIAASARAVHAQTQAPAAATAPQAAPPAPLVRTTVKLVLIDLVVTDHDNVVHGLERSRFHLLENGQERTIVSFDEHIAPDAATRPVLHHAEMPPHTYSNTPDYAESPAMTVLVLDALNTPILSQMDVRRRMIDYLDDLGPGNSMAIFTLSSRLRMISGFSTNLKMLADILKSPKGSPKFSPQIDTPEMAEQIGDISASSMNMQSAQMGAQALQQFESDSLSFQTDMRVAMTLEAFQELARYLSVIPGRKNIVWFSGSFPFAIEPDSSVVDPFLASRDYSDQVRETTQLLSDARIAVYPVDARGLMTAPRINVPSAGPASNSTYTHLMMRADAQRAAEQASMERIATDTGGKAYINTNGLMEALGDVVKTGASYYTIGYQPAPDEFDGQYHKFRVRIDNANYKLAYRSGYYADPPDKPSPNHPSEANATASSMMHGAPAATQVSFVARILPSTDPVLQGTHLSSSPAGTLTAKLNAPVHRYVVDIVVNLHNLTFNTAPDGSHKTQVHFALVAYDVNGNTINSLDHSFQLGFEPERFARLMSSGMPVRLELDLPEGPAYLRIAVNDLQSDRAGSIEVPIVVRAH